MANAYCIVFLAFTLFIAIMAMGWILIFNKDRAWQIQEWMLRTVKPQRTPEWEFDSSVRGVLLLLCGLGWIISLLYVLFSSS